MKTLLAMLVLGVSTIAFAGGSGTEDRCMYEVKEVIQITKTVMRFKAAPRNGDCESFNRDEIFVEKADIQAEMIASLRAGSYIEMPSNAVPLEKGFSKEGLAEVTAYKAHLEQLLEDPIYNDPCNYRYWEIQDMLNSLFFAQAYTGTIY